MEGGVCVGGGLIRLHFTPPGNPSSRSKAYFAARWLVFSLNISMFWLLSNRLAILLWSDSIIHKWSSSCWRCCLKVNPLCLQSIRSLSVDLWKTVNNSHLQILSRLVSRNLCWSVKSFSHKPPEVHACQPSISPQKAPLPHPVTPQQETGSPSQFQFHSHINPH